MARSSAARSRRAGLGAEQDADDGVREQGPAGQRVRAGPGAGRGAGRSKGLSRTPSAPRCR